MALDAETREQLIDTVRRFVAERLRPLEAKVSEDDAIPQDVLEEMKALGLYGLSIPEEYGGLDLSMEDECLVAIELGGAVPAEEEFTVSAGEPAGDGQVAACLVGIALTLLVSDAIPTLADVQLLESGTRQIGDELEHLAGLLEAGTRTSPIP